MGVAVIEGVVAHVVDLGSDALSRINGGGTAKGGCRGGGAVRFAVVLPQEAGGRELVSGENVGRIETGRSVEREVEIVVVGERVAAFRAAGIFAGSPGCQHVHVVACAADVMVSGNDVIRNAAHKGSAFVHRIRVAVPHGEPEIAIAAFRSFVINVVARIESERSRRQRRLTGEGNILHVVHQMSDTAFVIGHGWRPSWFGGEEAFIAFHQERKLTGLGAATKTRRGRNPRAGDAVVIGRVVIQAGEQGGVVGTGSGGRRHGGKRRIRSKIVIPRRAPQPLLSGRKRASCRA